MLKPTFIASHLRAALLTGLLVGGGALVGCHKKEPAPDGEALKQSLATIRKQLDELKTNFMSLRERVEKIPQDLPDFPEARARFFATEEGRGVTDAGAVVLASRLDEALRSRNREELQQIGADIGRLSDGARKLGDLHVKMLHQMMAFERMAEQQKQAAAEAKPAALAAPKPKAKRTKSKP